MSEDAPRQTRLRTAMLRKTGPTAFLLEPDAAARATLAAEFGADALRKLRFEGTVAPGPRSGFVLDAMLGFTAVQPCVVTLEPVTTRVDTAVTRRFVPQHLIEAPEPGSETEMPEDDTLEPLGEVIDLEAVMAEAVALALPAWPRKPGVALDEAVFADEGVAPLTDADAKPLAGLAALRDKMRGGPE